jgi:hypothetical protein
MVYTTCMDQGRTPRDDDKNFKKTNAVAGQKGVNPKKNIDELKAELASEIEKNQKELARDQIKTNKSINDDFQKDFDKASKLDEKVQNKQSEKKIAKIEKESEKNEKKESEKEKSQDSKEEISEGELGLEVDAGESVEVEETSSGQSIEVAPTEVKNSKQPEKAKAKNQPKSGASEDQSSQPQTAGESLAQQVDEEKSRLVDQKESNLNQDLQNNQNKAESAETGLGIENQDEISNNLNLQDQSNKVEIENESVPNNTELVDQNEQFAQNQEADKSKKANPDTAGEATNSNAENQIQNGNDQNSPLAEQAKPADPLEGQGNEGTDNKLERDGQSHQEDRDQGSEDKFKDKSNQDSLDGKIDKVPTKDELDSNNSKQDVEKKTGGTTLQDGNDNKLDTKNPTDKTSKQIDAKSKSDKDLPAINNKPKLRSRLSNLGNKFNDAKDKLNTAKNIAEDPGAAARQVAEDKIKELGKKAARKAAEQAARVAGNLARAAGQIAAQAINAVTSAVLGAVPEIVAVIIAVILFVALFTAVGVDAYCTPRPLTRGVIEYALTGDEKNLIQLGDGVPLVGDLIAKFGNAVGTKSFIYDLFYGSGGICPDKAPDNCAQGSATAGGTNGTYGTANGKVSAAECAKLKEYKAFIDEAAGAYGWPAPFIGAILSQETEVGLGGAISPKGCEGRGDIGGRGHGLGQVDQASGAFGKQYTETYVGADGKTRLVRPAPVQFPVGTKLVNADGAPLNDKAGKQLTWSDCRDNIMYVAYHLDEVRRYCKNNLKDKGPEGSATFLKSIADGYNRWCGGVKDPSITAERDGLRYGDSVINRAADVAKCFGGTAFLDKEKSDQIDTIINQLAKKTTDRTTDIYKNSIVTAIVDRISKLNSPTNEGYSDQSNKDILSQVFGGIDASAAGSPGSFVYSGEDATVMALIASGKVTDVIPEVSKGKRPKFDVQIKQKELEPNALKGLISILNSGVFDSVRISSAYRAGDNPTNGHGSGQKFDIDAVTYKGKQYTHQNANDGDSGSIEAFYELAKVAKNTGTLTWIITGGKIYEKISADSALKGIQIIRDDSQNPKYGGIHENHYDLRFDPNGTPGASSNSNAGNANAGTTTSGGCAKSCGEANPGNTLGSSTLTSSQIDNTYLTNASGVRGFQRKYVVLHHTSTGALNTVYTADKMASDFKKKAEARQAGYVHFTTGSKGEIYQILPDTDKPAGAIGAVIKNGNVEHPNSTALQIEMHYDPDKGENPTPEMLKSTAQLVAKYSPNPLDFYTHWGVQPFDRNDVRFIKPEGDFSDQTFLDFIKLVKASGAGPAWQKDEKEIAKLILKNNIENALSAYNKKSQIITRNGGGSGGFISENEISERTLQAGLSKVGQSTSYLDLQNDDNNIINGLVNGVDVEAAGETDQAIRERVAGYFKAGEFGQVPGSGFSDIDGILGTGSSKYKMSIVKFLDNAYKAGLSVFTGPKSYGRPSSPQAYTDHNSDSGALDVWGVGLLSDIKGKGAIKGMKIGPPGFGWAGGGPDAPAINGNTVDTRIKRHVDTAVDNEAKQLFEKLYDVAFASGQGNQFITRPEMLDYLKSKGKKSTGAKDIQIDQTLFLKGTRTPSPSFNKNGIGAHFHHFHFNFSDGDFKDYTGATAVGGGSSTPCPPPPCTQTPSPTPDAPKNTQAGSVLDLAQLNPFLLVDAEAAYGAKPTAYSQILADTKYIAFMKEVAAARGYEEYKDVGSENTEMKLALDAMVAASGGKLTVGNTYRGYDRQVGTFFTPSGVTSPISKYWSPTLTPDELAEVKKQYIARGVVSAPPGFSQHSTGLAVDFTPIEEAFEGSPGFAFLQAKGADFGFKISYPKGTNKGAGYEPWHWQFTGNDKYKLSNPISTYQIGGESGNPCSPVVTPPPTKDTTTPAPADTDNEEETSEE